MGLLLVLTISFISVPSFLYFRQRYQFRLKQMGKHSTLSDARENILNEVGFVWDSHQTAWSDHFQTLKAYALANGHCTIPPQLSKENAVLVTWCKHQRRQYKRYICGMDSTITAERIRCLESIGFDWNPRNLSLREHTVIATSNQKNNSSGIQGGRSLD
jgi:hypothetical protein